MPKYSPVTFYVEYDSRGKRVRRAFTDEYAAAGSGSRRTKLASDRGSSEPCD